MCGALVKAILRLLSSVGGISATPFWKAQIDEPSFHEACVGIRARQKMHIRSCARETKGLRGRFAPLHTMSKFREGFSQAMGGDMWTYFHFPAAGWIQASFNGFDNETHLGVCGLALVLQVLMFPKVKLKLSNWCLIIG